MPNQFTPKRQIVIPIGPSIAYVPLTKNMFCLIDSCDAEMLSDRNWCAWTPDGRNWYATSRHGLMHRVLSGVEGKQVDHRNGNGLDNRRSNHRSCTGPQNRLNVGLRRDNASGFRGVSFNKRNGKWFARIAQRFLGYRSTPEECAALYDAEASVLYGEFAQLNLPEK